MLQKAVSLGWGSEQEKALQQIQSAVQAALPFGPYDPTDSMVLEVPVADRDAVWCLWQVPYKWIKAQTFNIFKQSPAILCG